MYVINLTTAGFDRNRTLIAVNFTNDLSGVEQIHTLIIYTLS